MAPNRDGGDRAGLGQWPPFFCVGPVGSETIAQWSERQRQEVDAMFEEFHGRMRSLLGSWYNTLEGE